MEQNLDIKKYIVKFCIAYAIVTIALTAILILLDLNSNAGASVVVLMVSAMYVAGKFIEENKRTPNKKEKSNLVWLSLAGSWLISIIWATIVMLALVGTSGLAEIFKLMQDLGIVISFGILFLVSAIYLGILSWCYGGLANRQFQALQKKGKI